MSGSSNKTRTYAFDPIVLAQMGGNERWRPSDCTRPGTRYAPPADDDPTDDDPADNIDAAWLASFLLAGMSAKQAEAVQLWADGFTAAEAARLLGISRGSYRDRLARARAHIAARQAEAPLMFEHLK